MTKYKVEFDRIGRNKNVKPLVVDAANSIDMGIAISDYAAPHIRSADYDVGVNDDMSGGHILAGFHVAGRFTITAEPI